MSTCEFCGKEFSTKTNLGVHQRTAKYCLLIQGKESHNYECEYCNKYFTSQQSLNEHKSSSCREKSKKDCIKEYNEEILTLKEKNIKLELFIEEKDFKITELQCIVYKLEEKLLQQKKEYEAKLEKFENAVISVAEAARTPTITYNTNSNNHQVNNNQILNLSPEVVEPILREKLTFDIAKQGQKGLASFVLNNMLKGPNGELKYKCKDTARQNFEYINKNGDVEKDVRAKKLSQALVDGGVEKIAGEVGSKEWRDDGEKYERYGEKVTEIVMLSADDSTFRNTLTALTS